MLLIDGKRQRDVIDHSTPLSLKSWPMSRWANVYNDQTRLHNVKIFLLNFPSDKAEALYTFAFQLLHPKPVLQKDQLNAQSLSMLLD